MKIAQNYVFGHVEGLAGEKRATIKGVCTKTILLLGITLVVALLGINLFRTFNVITMILYLGIIIAQFVLQRKISRNPGTSKKLVIPYSILEGCSLAIFTNIIEYGLDIATDGKSLNIGLSISSLALIITISIFLACVILIGTGLVRPNQKVVGFLGSALLGIVIASVAMLLLSTILLLVTRNSANPINLLKIYQLYLGVGLITGLISVLVATGYIMVTVKRAMNMVDMGMDKSYEWYSAFGIAMNVVWLYMEVLRVLYYIVLLFGGNDRK